jgi:plasmid stability protein
MAKKQSEKTNGLKQIIIRGIPDELRYKLKVKCLKEHTSIKRKVLDWISQYVT